LGIELITILAGFLILIAFFHFIGNNDEFPFLLPFFFLATGVSRYNAVVSGDAHWVVVKYAKNIFNLNDGLALEALNLFFLGTVLFFFSYLFFWNLRNQHTIRFIDKHETFEAFLAQKKWHILILFGFFMIVNSITTVIVRNAPSLALGMSYFYLFGMAIGGIILLVFLMYRNISFKYNFLFKSVMLFIFIYAAYISYNPNLRFQFISWLIALGIIIVKDNSTLQKIRIYLVGGVFVVFFFAIAGNSRQYRVQNMTVEENIDLAVMRLSIAEDQNMLDGLMMVLQVYPKHLDYHYGMEHFEILLRPIPRALWTGKPVGGYTNKLKLNENMPSGTTVGISQTIFGTFYGEGGTAGIIFFSILYGYIFVHFFAYSKRYNSDVKYLFKGILIASAIPLLRGGDLPGIIAFIGMSYWPVFLFVYQYHQFIRRHSTIINSASIN